MEPYFKAPDDLYPEEIGRILEIYDEVLGPRSGLQPIDAESVYRDIQTYGQARDYRIGSRWTVHSKLSFRTPSSFHKLPVHFDINTNFVSPEEMRNILMTTHPTHWTNYVDEDKKVEVENATNKFYGRVEEYLRGIIEYWEKMDLEDE